MLHISSDNTVNESKITFNKVIKKIDYEKLVELGNTVEWNTILNFNDPQVAVNYLIKKLVEIINKSEISNTHTTRFIKLNPWITNGIIISIKTRDKLKKALKKNNSAQKLAEYKQYRNKLINVIKLTKNEYYQKKINKNSSDMKNKYTNLSLKQLTIQK